MKQPGNIVYFNKKDKSKTSETGICHNGKKASIRRPIRRQVSVSDGKYKEGKYQKQV